MPPVSSALETLVKIRKELHQKPELSNKEKETPKRIASELNKIGVDSVKENIGGGGVLARIDAKKSSRKTILFRAELDGIAVQEQSGVSHQSENRDVIHGCGHDGHMVILLGLAQHFVKNRPANTDIILLFQPAEETGEGARQVLNDPYFQSLSPDHAYALHNLPGFEQNSVLIKSDAFACASVGLDIRFEGKSSHAAYPEQGINPSFALGLFLEKIDVVRKNFIGDYKSNKMTVTFIHMGERAFGISPGQASVGVTIRSASDETLAEGVRMIEDCINELRTTFEGTIKTKKTEPFVATINDEQGTEVVLKAAKTSGFEISELKDAFPWSEDFGEFRNVCPITIFGLGAGKDHPPLHSEMYDFNDALIPAGIRMFAEILNVIDQ